MGENIARMEIIARSPQHVIELLDRAFNEGDLEIIMDFYEDAAIVVPEPGIEARGKETIREMYAKMLKTASIAPQMKIRVLEADGMPSSSLSGAYVRWVRLKESSCRRLFSGKRIVDGKSLSITPRGRLFWMIDRYSLERTLSAL